MKSIYILILIWAITPNSIFSQEMKVIENYLYSIPIPQEWEPHDGEKIFIRNTDLYTIEIISWRSPIKSENDIPNVVKLSINTFSRNDKSEISIEEIQDFHSERLWGVTPIEDTDLSSQTKRWIIKTESRNMDGTPANYISTYLFHKVGEKIHSVNISYHERMNIPEQQDLVLSILNHFKPKI